MTKNVLIIAQSFPPLGNIAARRFGYMVAHMPACGWQPWVLTMHGDGPLRVDLADERIIRIGQHPQAAGPSVVDTPRRGLSPVADVARRAAAVAGLRFRAVDYTCLGWRRAVIRQEDSLLARLPKVDLVLGTFGPAACLWLARRLARRLDTPWVADFRDLAALRPDGRSSIARRFDGLIERRLLRSAAAVTTVSPTLAAILAETYELPSEVVFNGWDNGDDVDKPRPSFLRACHADNQECHPYLYYAGRWYPERERAARLVLDALASRPDAHWLIRSLGPSEADARLRAEVIRRDMTDRVNVRGPCPPDQVQSEADAALANVVLDDVDCRERWSRGTLTGKLLELVAARPAVLAVARADSDIGPVLQETAKGSLCADAKSIGRLLDQLTQEPAAYSGDQQAITQYSKSQQATVLCRLFDRVVGRADERTSSHNPPLRKAS